MAERAVRAVKRPQQPSNAYLLQQQRRAARDVPLCVPELRLAWAAFGVGLGLVLLSLCLMIGGAASSNTVYGGEGSANLTIVYVGIAFLILGLAALGLFGFRFARVRQVQKADYVGRDCGHDNCAFPASDGGQAIPMTSKPLKFTTPVLPDSPNDSAYSSLVYPSNPGSELSARRLQQTNSQSAQYSQPPQRPLPPDAGQYHRVNSQDPRYPATRPGRPESSTNNPAIASTVEKPDGAESQRIQSSAYPPARPNPMEGQPGPRYPPQVQQGPRYPPQVQQGPRYPPQVQQGHPNGPTSSTNRARTYTDRSNNRSMEQPSTSQPRSGGPQTFAGNTRPSSSLNSSSLTVSDAARLSHTSAVVPVDRHPPPIQEYDPSFHASTSGATAHDPYKSHHVSRSARGYDSSSSGTII